MKLKAPTVFLVSIAVILGIVVYAELQGGDRPNTDDTGQPLFSFEEDDVQAFTIETNLDTLSFERDDEGTWQLVAPEQTVASDASVSFLLNLLATGESDRILTIEPANLGEFGLTPPQATVDIVLENQETHQIILGDFDFNQQFIYAQVDPETPSGENLEDSPEDVEVHLVSSAFDTAVNRPLEEWQQLEDTPEQSTEGDPNSEATSPDAP